MSIPFEVFEGPVGSVRIVVRDCDPWFVAADVCGVLGGKLAPASYGQQKGYESLVERKETGT